MNSTQSRLEIERHIRAIREWLADHTPREDWTPGQVQARNDRLGALARWIAIAQREERTDR